MIGSRNNFPELDDPFRVWIAIIGMGAAGASHFGSIVDRAIQAGIGSNIGIILVDIRREEEFGRGIAWTATQSHSFRANMRLHTIGFKKKVLDKILEKCGAAEVDNMDSISDDILFSKRAIVGEALHEDYLDYKRIAASADITVKVCENFEVSDFDSFGNGFVFVEAGGRSLFAHHVTLALGNQPKQTFPHLREARGYIYNPWDWSKYNQIHKNSRVAVIGLGPTAVDAILELDNRGVEHISAFSRSGRIQFPRPRGKPVDLKYIDKKTVEDTVALYKRQGRKLKFEHLEQMLTMEFGYYNACEGWEHDLISSKRNPRDALLAGLLVSDKERAWYSIMKSIDQITPILWASLDEDSRRTYMDVWRADHTIMSYGMATVQARRILDRLEAKTLSIHGGLDGKESVELRGGIIKVRYRVGDDELVSFVEEDFDFIINCTGIGSDVNNMNSPLVEKLLENGWIHPYNGLGGGVFIEFESGQITSPSGHPVGNLYSLTGSLTMGHHLLTNCIWQVWQSSERTAQCIVERIITSLPNRFIEKSPHLRPQSPPV